MQIFTQLNLVEELTDGTLFMTSIQTLIDKSSTEAERKQKERATSNAAKTTAHQHLHENLEKHYI